jgi:hypothetical protein
LRFIERLARNQLVKRNTHDFNNFVRVRSILQRWGRQKELDDFEQSSVWFTAWAQRTCECGGSGFGEALLHNSSAAFTTPSATCTYQADLRNCASRHLSFSEQPATLPSAAAFCASQWL